MPYCYYTCNLVPLDLLIHAGYSPRWLGGFLRDPAAPARRDALSVHPMTCPYVTKLVAAADALLGGAPEGDCLVVPGGCDAAHRMGDLLAATYPQRVFVLPLPRSSGPELVKTVAADLRHLRDWLATRRPDDAMGPLSAAAARPTDTGAATDGAVPPQRADADHQTPSLDYPTPPRPGGVFVVAGPLTDDSLLRLIDKLGAHVAGLESCTSPDRWKRLAASGVPAGEALAVDTSIVSDAATAHGTATPAAPPDYEALAARLLEVGMCPRRSTTLRRDYLVRRLDQSQPSSIIYARQSFCDPGAYDALLVAELAKERGLPYLEIEVDFPFDAGGPLRTRVEAFLESQLLDEDLLGDEFDDDLFNEEV